MMKIKPEQVAEGFRNLDLSLIQELAQAATENQAGLFDASSEAFKNPEVQWILNSLIKSKEIELEQKVSNAFLLGLTIGLVTPIAPASEPPPHAWEPDFSEGEPSKDSKVCGLCGKEHDDGLETPFNG